MYLILILYVAGLIHRVIAQSGSGIGAWASDPEPVDHAREIAKYAGCDQPDDDLLAKCLRSKTARRIINAHSAYLVKSTHSLLFIQLISQKLSRFIVLDLLFHISMCICDFG